MVMSHAHTATYAASISNAFDHSKTRSLMTSYPLKQVSIISCRPKRRTEEGFQCNAIILMCCFIRYCRDDIFCCLWSFSYKHWPSYLLTYLHPSISLSLSLLLISILIGVWPNTFHPPSVPLEAYVYCRRLDMKQPRRCVRGYRMLPIVGRHRVMLVVTVGVNVDERRGERRRRLNGAPNGH